MTTHAAALLLATSLLAGCDCGFSNRSDDYRCNDTTDCDPGRLCRSGWCVVDPCASLDCSGLDDQCNLGMCEEATGGCVAIPLADGTVCDDGLLCTLSEECTGGSCVGTSSMDCSALDTMCEVGACDEASASCVSQLRPDGTACEDGVFCTSGDTCTTGVCGGGGPTDCSAAEDDCNGSMCNEATATCDPVPGMDGTACSDGPSCAMVGTCSSGLCLGAPDELACAAAEICNPTVYPGATGCGEAPASLVLSCPDTTAMMASTCSASLTTAGGSGVPDEAGRITCSATAGAITLFADDFDSGSFDPAWMPIVGAPIVDNALGNPAAVSIPPSAWTNGLLLNVSGLEVACVDFDVAQANAGGGERLRWRAVRDGGPLFTFFDLSFGGWETSNLIFTYNRNACISLGGTTNTLDLRLRLDTNSANLWVDNVVVTGIAAPLNAAPGGGPDPFDDLSQWSTISGTPTIGSFGGSNVLYAEGASFVVERVVDGSSCDVVDVDFDFGFANPDAGETIELLAAVDGGPFSSVELLDLQSGVWNVDSALLPWLGLRRLSDLFPDAAGSANIAIRLSLSATGAGRRVWVDEFEVRCADLPAPMVSAVVDAGAGMYSVDVTSAVPAEVTAECVWATTNDGPVIGSDPATFSLP